MKTKKIRIEGCDSTARPRLMKNGRWTVWLIGTIDNKMNKFESQYLDINFVSYEEANTFINSSEELQKTIFQQKFGIGGPLASSPGLGIYCITQEKASEIFDNNAK